MLITYMHKNFAGVDFKILCGTLSIISYRIMMEIDFYGMEKPKYTLMQDQFYDENIALKLYSKIIGDELKEIKNPKAASIVKSVAKDAL